MNLLDTFCAGYHVWGVGFATLYQIYTCIYIDARAAYANIHGIGDAYIIHI